MTTTEAAPQPAETDTHDVDEIGDPGGLGRPVALLGALAATVALAACGGGGGSEGPSPPPVAGPGPTPAPTPAPTTAPAPPSRYALDPADRAAARLLLHATVGATDADIADVKRLGAAGWLDAQMARPVQQKAWDWLVARGYAAIDDNRFYDGGGYAIQFVMGHQMVTQPDTLRKRVALALTEMFVVSVQVANFSWTHLGLAHYWDQLNANAFGTFRQLLEDVTLNPLMGAWLNTRGNAKEDAATGRVPDENYAREVMQLFSIGLVQLNLDGTPKIDSAGRPLPSYTQDEVTALARVFTGYDWDYTEGLVTVHDGSQRLAPGYARRPMVLDAARHSTLASSFLGTSIAAGTSGREALRIALDTLANHPNVGPFFARQMIQRLVTSNPSPAYVARVAAKFNDNGAGVRGDLKAVWKAILLDDEARGAAGLTSTTHGKLREPMVRHYQWGRSFGVTSAAGSWKWSYDFENPRVNFGQAAFFSPSVFNFFRPGYVPPGTALAASGATAPEFQIVNESTVSQWLNAMELWALLGMYVVWPDRPGYPNPYAGPYPGDGWDISTGYPAEMAIAHDAVALLKRLNLLLAAGQVSDATLARIEAALVELTVTSTSADEQKRWRVASAICYLMACPEYLVQK